MAKGLSSSRKKKGGPRSCQAQCCSSPFLPLYSSYIPLQLTSHAIRKEKGCPTHRGGPLEQQKSGATLLDLLLFLSSYSFLWFNKSSQISSGLLSGNKKKPKERHVPRELCYRSQRVTLANGRQGDKCHPGEGAKVQQPRPPLPEEPALVEITTCRGFWLGSQQR
jgi:hypothetical protein